MHRRAFAGIHHDSEEERMKGMLRKGFFAAATAAALGFGATQALAAPDQAAGRRACSVLRDAYCNDWCQAKGYDAGQCNPLYEGGCRCWFY